MSGRYYKMSIHGGKHLRKKTTRRPLPLPKKAQERKKDEDDEVYVNLSHKHRLTYLRYPSGSGKRPPPKPKRLKAREEISSPPPQSPPTVAPQVEPKPQLPPTPTSLALRDLHGPLQKAAATPTSAQSPKSPWQQRPLLPPISNLANKRGPVRGDLSSGPPTPNTPATPERKKGPIKPPHLKPQTSPDPSHSDLSPPDKSRISWSREKLAKFNNLIGKAPPNVSSPSASSPSTTNDTSLPLPGKATPPKHPLLPPTVKPRKGRPKTSDESNLDFMKSEGDVTTRAAIPPPSSLPPPPRTRSMKRPPPLPSCSTSDLPRIPYPPNTPQDPAKRPLTSSPMKHVTSAPDIIKSPPPMPRPHLQSSPERQPGTPHARVPLPKPRQRRSRGDDLDNLLSPTHPSKRIEKSPSPPAPLLPPKPGNSPAHVSSSNSSRPRNSPAHVSSSSSRPGNSPAHVSSSSNREREGIVASLPAQTNNRAGVTDKLSSLQIQSNGFDKEQPAAVAAKAPPVPRKRANNKSPEPKATPHTATDAIREKSQMSTRKKKGGGIRMPLWKAPPPPTLTPPTTPTYAEPFKKKKSSPPSLALTTLHTTPTTPLSPPTSPSPVAMTTSTSFILPPFRSSGVTPSPGPDPDLERCSVLDQAPPIQFSSVPQTPTSPRTLEFEDSLFEYKTVQKKPLFQQQHLPINVVQELQNNLLRKQVTRR